MTEETSPDQDKTEATASKTRISTAQWVEIEERYQLGTAKIGELAKEFGVSRQHLSKRFKDKGITHGSKAHEIASAVNKAVINTAAGTAAAKMPVERFADKQKEWIEETRISGYKSLKQSALLATKQISDAITKGAPLASIDDDLKAAARYNKLIIDNMDARLRTLNAANVIDETDLPSIIIDDLEDEELLEHHRGIGALTEDDDTDEYLNELLDPDL